MKTDAILKELQKIKPAPLKKPLSWDEETGEITDADKKLVAIVGRGAMDAIEKELSKN